MEDDKKKRKKNKKKKNKQANDPTESDKVDAKELISDSQSHVQETESNNGQVSEIEDAPNDIGGHIIVDGDGLLSNGIEINLAEAEKQHWLDREATLEEKIKELQAEKDAQIQKEALLEEKIKQLTKEIVINSEKEIRLPLNATQNENIKQLHDEKNASMQNEARLKEGLAQLEREKDALTQKEGSLEQKIQQLQREMNAQLQKETNLEEEILELKGEKDSWVQTEAGFREKFNQLEDESSLLNSKLVTLEEKVKQTEIERDSWILKENSAKESIANLTIDNTKLRVQVVELELSRESLFSETQELKEFISSLQLRINNLEMDKKTSENGHANNEVEAAHALVEKLMAENSELVEKVSELYAKLEMRGVRTEQSPSDGSVPGAVAGSISEVSKIIHISENNQPLEDVMVKDERNGELVNVDSDPRVAHSSELTEVDEIVQIPLDENEVKETNSDVPQNDDGADVELTDAPLIGAPFRIISFVARYVSGADLVSKNTGS